jgi:hypothetical protein
LNWRAGVTLSLLAFIGGGIAVSWLSGSGLAPWGMDSPPPIAKTDIPPVIETPPVTTPPVAAPVVPQIVQPIADSVRTEAMLLIMAARRASAAGQPLGDQQARLQAAFGESQPAELAKVIAADKAGLTTQSLLKDLDTITPALLSGAGGTWEKLQREVATLFVLRKGASDASGPEVRLKRARDYLAAGNVAGAIRFVESLPGAASAKAWLDKARRYQEAQAALDSMERMTLAMPTNPIPAAPILLPDSIPSLPPAEATE